MMDSATLRTRLLSRNTGLVAVVMIALSLIYLPTLQTIVNGSSHLMMIDVGETQVVLNTWGTLHPTSYPLYVILGNILVIILKFFGVSAVTAPALVSWLWGIVTLILVYILATHLTQKPLLVAAVTFVIGLTRFVWVHNVVAEVYSFAFMLQILLFLVALWRKPIQHRILWLAFIGGIGVSHHRTIILLIPALLYAAWPDLKPLLRRPPVLILVFLIGLIGFLPYLYLPLRANTDAAWVYGEPSTPSGFLEQFRGKEADHFFGLPESQEAFQKNFDKINDTLEQDISIPGILLGLLGLGFALKNPNNRRISITMLLAIVPNYIFAAGLFTDILAPTIFGIQIPLAFGWLFLIEALLSLTLPSRFHIGLQMLPYAALIYFSLWLYQQNYDFVHGLTHDKTGLETIALAENAPSDSTLMLAWGPRYFAVGFAQDVEHQLSHIHRADHKADFATIIENGTLITPEYTFYNQSIAWWEAHLGTKIYLYSAAPYFVQIDTTPHLAESPITLPADFDTPIPVIALNAKITCTDQYIVLTVDWVATETPSRSLSIMVHLLDANGTVIDQADQSAPVYGWRPMTDWLPNEIVTDVYPLPRNSKGQSVRFGLYEQISPDTFQNYGVQILPILCE